MKFHPDEQLSHGVSAGDRTTDPWIKRPVLYPYTTGTYAENHTQPAQIKPHPAKKIYTVQIFNTHIFQGS